MKGAGALGARLFALLARRARSDAARSAATRAAAEPAVSAICIPIEARKDASFVLGVVWTPHLTRDSVTVEAATKARKSGFTHSFIRSRAAAESYGLAKIDAKDAKAFRQLVPLSVAFAQGVQDKAATSLFLLDLRDPATDKGTIYLASATRGHPVSEILVADEDEALRKLTAWAGQSRSGVSVYVDTADEEFFGTVARAYPSATQMWLTKIASAGVPLLEAVRQRQFKRLHLALLVAAAVVVLGWDYGKQAYDQHLEQIDAAEAQKQAARRYAAARDAEYQNGYAARLEVGLTEALRELQGMPLVRNGWEFVSGECVMAQSQCTLTWSRLYGTYDSFLESAVPGNVTLDATNYRLVRERRAISMGALERPGFDKLPSTVDFVKRNGDRSDTFQLAGLKEFTVDPFKPLATWTGTGVPPGPVMTVAAWKVTAMPDQIVEAVATGRLSEEFGINRLTLSLDKGNQINLTVEGNVYVRQ